MLKSLTPALLALGLLPVPAAAQSQAVQVRVEYRDLNLHSPVGVARLDHRIARAVSDLCPNDRPGDLGARIAERRCRAARLAEVAPQRARVLAGGLAQQTAIASN